ncbi:hypothetical protein QFC24_005368 [Naganishia onofrii]|uniref:Uncharacterized protein n=1 Tax=Naganishia onofrii TaxID=1851511 RepID=A0ACC2X9W2_9TREE|nr:hypothetical protein QFC24_005368 [Naganishia onofrii]
MRTDAIALGLLQAPSSSFVGSFPITQSGISRSIESDDSRTHSQPAEATLQDASLHSSAADVFLSQNRNITPAVPVDSRPVTQISGVLVEDMKISSYEKSGYHRIATILTSKLPSWFDKQPVNIGFNRCFADENVAITWLGEASDQITNPAGRGFICRITQEPKYRTKLLETDRPVLRFEYTCATQHLDLPHDISHRPPVFFSESPLDDQQRRKEETPRRSSEASSTSGHDTSGTDGSDPEYIKFKHINHQTWEAGIDRALFDGEIIRNAGGDPVVSDYQNTLRALQSKEERERGVLRRISRN